MSRRPHDVLVFGLMVLPQAPQSGRHSRRSSLDSLLPKISQRAMNEMIALRGAVATLYGTLSEESERKSADSYLQTFLRGDSAWCVCFQPVTNVSTQFYHETSKASLFWLQDTLTRTTASTKRKYSRAGTLLHLNKYFWYFFVEPKSTSFPIPNKYC